MERFGRFRYLPQQKYLFENWADLTSCNNKLKDYIICILKWKD